MQNRPLMVVSHLADANKELDRQTSYENLIEFPDINSNLEKDTPEKSSYVSEFGQVNLSLYMFMIYKKN